jgi:adenine-specific DNA-methyltransferase
MRQRTRCVRTFQELTSVLDLIGPVPEIDAGEDVLGMPATFVAATIDLQMGDLLKNRRSSQIFSVCGAPDIAVTWLDEEAEDDTPRWRVKLRGLGVFDPITLRPHHAAGDDVP